MLFNSLEFIFFFPLLFAIYWAIRSVRYQNVLLLLSSYFFYGIWDYRFLSLLLISSFVDYVVGINIEKSENSLRRKSLLAISILVNLGLLFTFKYFNFFIDSFTELFQLEKASFGLNIILPIGISFYTFQTLGYSIDVYRKRVEPCRSPIKFFTYVAFFPQLVAGPIERASQLLPQFDAKRSFSYVQGRDGARQVLWGFFKKVVIADNCAIFVDSIFSNYSDLSGYILVIGAVFFAIQIYCDFSGYSDIAIGIASLLGINLMQNFANPYFARDISEFWRKWHISLTTWFRDYIYIPLGGSKVKLIYHLRNILVVFLVSGFWHGANWTFLFWGLTHVLLFIPLVLRKSNRIHLKQIDGDLPSSKEFFQILTTFTLVSCAWIFFRSPSISDALNYIYRIFIGNEFNAILDTISKQKWNFLLLNMAIIFATIVEWVNRGKPHGLFNMPKNKVIRIGLYTGIVLLIIEYFHGDNPFIYFQF